MRTIAILLVWIVAVAPAAAQFGYCVDDEVDATEVWVVDKDSELPTGMSINDGIRLVDSALVNIAQTSRAKIRHRVSAATNADCTIGGGGGGASCVDFSTTHEICAGVTRGPCVGGWFCNPFNEFCDSAGMCQQTCTQDSDCPTFERCNPGPTPRRCVARSIGGFANNSFGRGWLTMCANNLGTADGYVNSDAVHSVMRHELGHTFGLDHTDAEGRDLNVNGRIDSCVDENLPAPGCASIGCTGELMCTRVGCNIGAGVQLGDSRGLRLNYNGAPSTYATRSVYVGTMGANGPTNIAVLPTKFSIHQPRMDCAASGIPVNECAIVRHRLSSSDAMMRVDTLNGNVTVAIDDNLQEADSAPDITLDLNGNTAWVVWAEKSRPMLRRIPLTAAGGTTEIEIQIDTSLRHDFNTLANDYFGTDIYANVPPRVAVVGGQVIVAVYGSGAFLASGSFAPPRMRLFRFDDNITGPPTLIGLDFPYNLEVISATNFISGEFDIDCAGNECTIVAPRMRLSSQGNVNDGLAASLTITYPTNGGAPTAGTWVYNFDHPDVTSVVGVARVQLSTRVSYGTRSTGGATNSRYNVHSGTSIASAPTGYAYVSDAQACASTTVDGQTIPANTMLVGGNSIVNSGRFLTWGNQNDGSNFCF